MKKLVFIAMICCGLSFLGATGVLINKNNTTLQFARLQSTAFNVAVDNQVANVQVTETFINTSTGFFYPRYYFPMQSSASATQLRWLIHGEWHSATIDPTPSNPQGGPSSFPNYFGVYLQLMPLVFDLSDSLSFSETVSFELTYVQMLNYNFGSFTLNLKNNYDLIQTYPLLHQELNISINSDKQILDFDIIDVESETTYTAHTATGSAVADNIAATQDYRCVWRVSTAELGSWGMSTLLDEVPDSGNHGFFVYTFEEESLPADTTFAMNLNIVIDVSGSMTWENRLEYAKTAAVYIINHLQNVDNFNVILFDHEVRPLWNYLMPNNSTTRNTAINYIQNYEITSLNGTNLHGGLSTAISQFSAPAPGYKNCVILFSDGQPNVGITDTYQIVQHINQQISNNNSDANLFDFGIGSTVNYELLDMLANEHHGAAIFLESSEIIGTVTGFYDVMRNPIMFSPSVTFGNPANFTEVYPSPVPALYGGLQTRIVGRYNSPGDLDITISGYHEGTNHSYNYGYPLAQTELADFSFVPKLWAKAKISDLLVQYYAYDPTSPIAVALRAQIIEISINYGVVCVFTSFSEGPPTENDDDIQPPDLDVVLYPNYPNPFNPQTTLSFEVLVDLQDEAEIRIYNIKGQLVRIMKLQVTGKGKYSIVWDGKDTNQNPVGSGVYFYSISFGKYLLSGKMLLQK